MNFRWMTHKTVPASQWLLAVSLAIGLPATAQPVPPAASQPPGVYYSWRDLTTSSDQCLARSQQALDAINIGETQQVDNSIAGRTADSTIIFVCLPNQASLEMTTVMVIIASQDDQAALDLRSALQAAF